ncbi:hypothetical protein CBOM_08091 [Ceraceosorus bombacis]|uniref:Uncharacterized protein n=1 Tax=Ceraceosorus bombacis TaxID=401625 RepID=A0A0P1BKH9_9BASI|nr:hypothetical protein CBOM_08091 [Ceraceosorus bombacis]
MSREGDASHSQSFTDLSTPCRTNFGIAGRSQGSMSDVHLDNRWSLTLIERRKRCCCPESRLFLAALS